MTPNNHGLVHSIDSRQSNSWKMWYAEWRSECVRGLPADSQQSSSPGPLTTSSPNGDLANDLITTAD